MLHFQNEMAETDQRGAWRFGNGAYFLALAALVTVLVWYLAATERHTSTSSVAPTASPAAELACTVVARSRLDELPEASGLAVGRRTPDVLWSHNDSGAPVVIALNTNGAVVGRVRLNGASVDNWEDISIAPCGNDSCLYIADSGNGGGTQRNDVVIYRAREPLPSDKHAEVTQVLDAVYPDGQDHEAEGVFVVDGRLFLITKGHPARLFRFPDRLEPGLLGTLVFLGEVPTERFLQDTIPRRTRVTDAETSPDGRWVAIRTNDALLVYRATDLASGRLGSFWYASLKSLEEPRGEGVAMSNDGDVFLVGEGTGQRPGTFAHMKCVLPRS